MEILGFYWINILAGMILVFALGMIGRHLVARNQSMEVMLLGQEFQTSLLMAALFIGLFETGDHDHHSFHLETFVSLIFVLLYHFSYLFFLKKYRNFKIEGAIVFIILLMGFSHLVVLMSPVVEFHMVKSFLGDIVTVSQNESITVALFSFFSIIILKKIDKNTELDTIEIALFNKTTKKRAHSVFFSILVLLLMLFSIHLFGSLFTIGAMIIPAFISGIFKINHQQFNILTILNSLSVVVAFFFLLFADRLPTTVVIIFLIFMTSLIGSMFLKRLS